VKTNNMQLNVAYPSKGTKQHIQSSRPKQ